MDIGGDPSAPRMRPKPCPVLYEIGCFGEYAQSNILIRGDAQDALEALRRTPPFADEYVEGVKVAYLDPPSTPATLTATIATEPPARSG